MLAVVSLDLLSQILSFMLIHDIVSLAHNVSFWGQKLKHSVSFWAQKQTHYVRFWTQKTLK